VEHGAEADRRSRGGVSPWRRSCSSRTTK
jgi:hypothetical protein